MLRIAVLILHTMLRTIYVRAEVAEDWKQLFQTCADDAPPDRIVYLWTLDEPARGLLSFDGD